VRFVVVICICCLKSLQKDICNTDFFSSFAFEYRLNRFMFRVAGGSEFFLNGLSLNSKVYGR
jgi:hypothetical protein